MKPFHRNAAAVAGTALCCLLVSPQVRSETAATEATARPERSSNATTQSRSKDETNSSPRERGRILVKRNPIASEYQLFGDIGTSPGADADGEGVDFRSFFPASDPNDAVRDFTRLGYALNFNNLSGEVESGFRASATRRFGTQGDWVVSVQARSSASDRLIEHYQSVWQQTELDDEGGYAFLDRPRFSLDEIYTRNTIGALQIGRQLSEQHSVYFKTYHQDYFDNFYRNRLEVQLGSGQRIAGSEVADADKSIVEADFRNARTRRYFGDTDNARSRQHHVFGGNYRGEQWTIDYAAYAHKWNIDSTWYNWNFNDTGLALGYRLDDPYRPTLTLHEGLDLVDSSQATFSSLRLHESFTRDRDLAARIDAERRLLVSDREIWIQTGLNHREKERENGEDREVFLPSPDNLFTLSDVSFDTGPRAILDRTYTLQSGLDPDKGRRFFETNPESFPRDAYRSQVESAPESYTAEEAVTSAYFLAASSLGEWTLEAGARIERTETATRGTVVIPQAVNDESEGTLIEEVVNPSNGQVNVIKDLYSENSYTNFIPSAEATFELGPDSELRASWFQLLMRPQYFNIVDYRRVSIPTRSVSEGNPNLKPTEIDKLRLAWVKDFSVLGTLSVEAYLIDIESFFYGSVSTEYIQEGGVPTLYRVSRVENGDSGKIRGFELQWQKRFDALPVFDNGSASLAYTYSDSEARVNTRPGDLLPVPERSEHLLKASVSGEIGKFRSEFALTYQSEALDDLGSSVAQDIYRRPVISAGLDSRYALTEQLSLSLNLINLTDHPERSYEAEPVRVTQNQYSSWIATFGVLKEF